MWQRSAEEGAARGLIWYTPCENNAGIVGKINVKDLYIL